MAYTTIANPLQEGSFSLVVGAVLETMSFAPIGAWLAPFRVVLENSVRVEYSPVCVRVKFSFLDKVGNLLTQGLTPVVCLFKISPRC